MYPRTSRAFIGLVGLACCTVSAIIAPSVQVSAGWTNVESYKSVESQKPLNQAPVFPFQVGLTLYFNKDLSDDGLVYSVKEDRRKPKPYPKFPPKFLCSAIIFARYEQDAVHKPPWGSLIV